MRVYGIPSTNPCFGWHVCCRGSQLALASLSADGQVSQQPSLAADGGQLTGAQLAVGEAGVAALSADGSSLCAAAQSALACQGLAALVPAGVSVAGARLVPGSCSAHAVLQVAGGAAVLALGGSSGASMVKFVPDATASGCFLGQGADATPLVALATPSTAGLRVQVVSAADGSSVQEAALPSLAPQLVTSHAVGVAALFAAPSSGTFRQAITAEWIHARREQPGTQQAKHMLWLACACGTPHHLTATYHLPCAAGSWLCLTTTAWRWWRAGRWPGCGTRS